MHIGVAYADKFKQTWLKLDMPEGSRVRDAILTSGLLDQFPEIDRSRVLLMPLGIDIDELDRIGAWLDGYCREHAFHFCPRRQIEWFGLRRGT